MALEGNLKDFGLADILQLIYFQKKTGVLSLRSRTDAVRIVFSSGNVVGASSKRREESNRLGRMLVQRGLLTEAGLQTALEKSRTSAERLGRVLFDTGQVPVEDVRAALSEQVTQTVVQIFNWKEGHYEFLPQEVAVDSKVSVAIDTDQLLMEGLRVTDEWTLYDSKVSLAAIYQPAELPDIPLDVAESQVLSHIDGVNDVNTLMDLTTLDQIEVARCIVSLLDKGYIREVTVTEVDEVPVMVRRRGMPLRNGLYILCGLILFLMIAMAGFQSRDAIDAFSNFSKGVALERVRLGVETFQARNGRLPEKISELGDLSAEARNAGITYEPGKGRAGFKLSVPSSGHAGVPVR